MSLKPKAMGSVATLHRGGLGRHASVSVDVAVPLFTFIAPPSPELHDLEKLNVPSRVQYVAATEPTHRRAISAKGSASRPTSLVGRERDKDLPSQPTSSSNSQTNVQNPPSSVSPTAALDRYLKDISMMSTTLRLQQRNMLQLQEHVNMLSEVLIGKRVQQSHLSEGLDGDVTQLLDEEVQHAIDLATANPSIANSRVSLLNVDRRGSVDGGSRSGSVDEERRGSVDEGRWGSGNGFYISTLLRNRGSRATAADNGDLGTDSLHSHSGPLTPEADGKRATSSVDMLDSYIPSEAIPQQQPQQTVPHWPLKAKPTLGRFLPALTPMGSMDMPSGSSSRSGSEVDVARRKDVDKSLDLNPLDNPPNRFRGSESSVEEDDLVNILPGASRKFSVCSVHSAEQQHIVVANTFSLVLEISDRDMDSLPPAIDEDAVNETPARSSPPDWSKYLETAIVESTKINASSSKITAAVLPDTPIQDISHKGSLIPPSGLSVPSSHVGGRQPTLGRSASARAPLRIIPVDPHDPSPVTVMVTKPSITSLISKYTNNNTQPTQSRSIPRPTEDQLGSVDGTNQQRTASGVSFEESALVLDDSQPLSLRIQTPQPLLTDNRGAKHTVRAKSEIQTSSTGALPKPSLTPYSVSQRLAKKQGMRSVQSDSTDTGSGIGGKIKHQTSSSVLWSFRPLRPRDEQPRPDEGGPGPSLGDFLGDTIASKVEQTAEKISFGIYAARMFAGRVSGAFNSIFQIFLHDLATPKYTEMGTSLASIERKRILSMPLPEHFFLHPMSRFRVTWDFILSLILFFTLIAIPVLVSFEDVGWADLEPLSWAMTIIFSVDTVLSLFTLQIINGCASTLGKSQMNYIQNGFIPDVITCIPFDIIFAQASEFPETLLLLRLIRCSNLMSITGKNPVYRMCSKRFQRFFGFGGAFMAIFFFLFLLVIFLHAHACMVFLFGKITYYRAESWLPLQETVLSQSILTKYTWSLFQALSNTFPVTGYKPSDVLEQWFTGLAVLIGALLYAALVGVISSFSFGMDSSGRLYKQKMDEVNEYMTYKRLTEHLKTKVRQYYELKYRGKYFDELGIIMELNAPLRQEIAIHNCRDLIQKVPFLRRHQQDGRDELFLGRIANALKATYFIKGDHIFEQGRVGNEMYFILSGHVEIVVAGKAVGSLADGSFFGEVALLGQIPRTATIRATSNCVLYCLERSDFETIIQDYDDMAARIREVYQERMARVREESKAKQAVAADALLHEPPPQHPQLRVRAASVHADTSVVMARRDVGSRTVLATRQMEERNPHQKS
ncbi:hypothetical protein SmJEL517_g01330 [Synchytrium microbalum]|uniref:Cyclic nucleotide-binding domain-containing protein n=1 Tax=Synchytrium microbalum TaxID=1806994 RepID=A0A507CA78_9FUNG|nr:uncharacterized protein SmJEL517_g01330 [Synchytrium microbalum]TPX36502.1 hypothetical protein SmJEL517_g01330 [Synchytrium microbalum]